MRIKFLQKIIDKLRFKNDKFQIHGENNIVEVPKKNQTTVIVWGSNNKVILDKSVNKFIGSINIGWRDCPVNNCSVIIGPNSTSNGTRILVLEDDSHVKIGSDCMFSANIELDCTDTHSIFDKETGELLNKGKFITIGNHVWIGKNVLVNKNSAIGDNCVVGAGSIVTKEFTQNNCIIAGVPAKIRKNDIDWSETRPNLYVNEK